MGSFAPLELGQPGKPVCPDQYTTNSTLNCPGSYKLTIQVSLAAIYLSFGQGIAGVVFGVDEPYLAVSGTILRSFDAIRVRNFTPGVPAQVLITAVAK